MAFQIRTLLIIGSTSDIGTAIAAQYLKQNVAVILAARQTSSLMAQQNTIKNILKEPFIPCHSMVATLILIKRFMMT